METFIAWHSWLNGLVWGAPIMVLLVGAGVLFTFATGGVQFTKLAFAMRTVFGMGPKPAGEGTVTSFQALATALASTVGVGNIAGVATAISLGGPGALFWLLVSGVLGMATKFAEVAIALNYRVEDRNGVMRGGAMYILSRGLGLPKLGAVFAALTGLAALGIGNMVQANSVADVVRSSFGIPTAATGIVLVVITAAVILGGIKRIAEVTEILVPGMCAIYIVGALFIVLRFAGEIPGVVSLVLSSAFEGHAAVGGFTGAAVGQAVRYGIARGLFSNEAGLGSAPIVHASAVTDHPVRQACYGIFEVFVDTLVICLLSGLVILTTGAWTEGSTGATLSMRAFQIGLPGVWGGLVVSIGLILFAYSTIVGWAYYGDTAVTYLFGTGASVPYRVLWCVFVYLGATGALHLIWDIADTLNGLMAVPNLIAVIGSLPVLRRLVKEFFAKNG